MSTSIKIIRLSLGSPRCTCSGRAGAQFGGTDAHVPDGGTYPRREVIAGRVRNGDAEAKNRG